MKKGYSINSIDPNEAFPDVSFFWSYDALFFSYSQVALARSCEQQRLDWLPIGFISERKQRTILRHARPVVLDNQPGGSSFCRVDK